MIKSDKASLRYHGNVSLSYSKYIYFALLDYVDEIYTTFLNSGGETLKHAYKALVDMTPAPMNTMIEKLHQVIITLNDVPCHVMATKCTVTKQPGKSFVIVVGKLTSQ